VAAPQLFDHLVGSDEQCLWDAETERFRRFEIDHKLKFGRLLDRYVAWLGAAQNLVGWRLAVPQRGYPQVQKGLGRIERSRTDGGRLPVFQKHLFSEHAAEAPAPIEIGPVFLPAPEGVFETFWGCGLISKDRQSDKQTDARSHQYCAEAEHTDPRPK